MERRGIVQYFTFIEKTRNMFKNLWRLIKVYYIKFLKTNGSSHDLALAVAIGMFIGCIIPIGLWMQTVLAIIIAIKFKTNPGVAYAATWITNPYSVVILYPIFCFVGARVIGATMTFSQIKGHFILILHDFSWHEMLNLSSQLATSFFVGAFIFGIIAGGSGYLITYKLLSMYRGRKKNRQLKNKRIIKEI